MINKKVQDALNRQCNREMYSAYLYLSMSAYFQSLNLKGCANWMRVQTQEEMVHAMKFYDHVIQRGGRVVLADIEAPPTEWKSPREAFEKTYEHEQKVTGLIHDLVDLAIAEKDHASVSFLQWFVTEQVEEEESASDLAEKLKLIGGDGNGLLMLDKELGQRVFTPPAATKPGASDSTA
jgi:ferritin